MARPRCIPGLVTDFLTRIFLRTLLCPAWNLLVGKYFLPPLFLPVPRAMNVKILLSVLMALWGCLGWPLPFLPSSSELEEKVAEKRSPNRLPRGVVLTTDIVPPRGVAAETAPTLPCHTVQRPIAQREFKGAFH